MRENVLSRDSAISRLERNRVKLEGTEISIPLGGVGLSLWAAIDCLVNRHKYHVKKER
jgi:hypothetical protein